MINMQRPYFILSNQLVVATIMCSGLLTGFQALATPANQKPLIAPSIQTAKDTTSAFQQAALDPDGIDDKTTPPTSIDQPVPLTKPQPLPLLPPAYMDLSGSLDALVNKQTIQMDPYIPFIQEITIGIEQISLAKNLWHELKKLKNRNLDQSYEWAGTLSILWKGNIQLVGSLGYVSLYPHMLKSNKQAYRTEGFYGGLGIGYVSHYNSTNNLYAGVHYNRAHFTNYTIPSNTSTQAISKDLTASWFEVIIGTESRLFEKIALYGGCTLHMGWLYNCTPFNEAKNYVIAGYGLNANKLNLGLNLYILYKLSFTERMIKLT